MRGFYRKIAPTTRKTDHLTTVGAPSLVQLREALSTRFHSVSDLKDDELFSELPPERQRHNNLPPVDSPLYSQSDISPLVLPLQFEDSPTPQVSPLPLPLRPIRLFPNPNIPANPVASSSTNPLILQINQFKNRLWLRFICQHVANMQPLRSTKRNPEN